MEHIQMTFSQCKKESRPALLTYVTAGFPTKAATPEIMLSMQAGGADIIELGIPSSDSLVDGPVILQSNLQALRNGVTVSSILEMVKITRNQGLNIPVLLMGHYNPILSYGVLPFLLDCKASGVSGVIVVDLPPEEAVDFSNGCVRTGLSYIPLIAPSTPLNHMDLLCTMATSFIYVVSRMGVTGTTATISSNLPNQIERVKQIARDIPLAVGFGISTREHFLKVASIADGVIIGSQIIKTISVPLPDRPSDAVKNYCQEISGQKKTRRPPAFVATENTLVKTLSIAHKLPGKFGSFGGQFVPEPLARCLRELERGFYDAIGSPDFWKEYYSYNSYLGRPSHLHWAPRLTKYAGGANIWVKREDLNHTGSTSINNALGQMIVARWLGKTNIIAETSTGQHGVATATVCAKFGMKCTIYMGANDAQQQQAEVTHMRMLGATVVAVETGSRRVVDAINEAFRVWIGNLETTHYMIGSAIGPHPFPTMVRTFQSVIGDETKLQILVATGHLPDAVVASVGEGSHEVGMFHAFVEDASVQLVGVEDGGPNRSQQSATPSNASVGILHGARTYVLQDSHGECLKSAGMGYPGVAPELANWKESHRVKFITANDTDAMRGLKALEQMEDIIPTLESCHAAWGAVVTARDLGPGKSLVVCLSGQGGPVI
ncbi:tryptophan synthetase [Aspergillus nanangensis]|uniref:Tryptophan synthase n=1 Tax=Aspergillus nanangensis TaxID=2582783 RepID=A0AAD4H0R0_ASPNN|nr:tryptophan synthetase [Aspergillus nanangensis]